MTAMWLNNNRRGGKHSIACERIKAEVDLTRG